MKKYYISINIYAKSTTIQLDSIEYDVASMLVKEERYLSMSAFSNLNDFSNYQIRNLKIDKPIDSPTEGLYVFWPMSEHSYNSKSFTSIESQLFTTELRKGSKSKLQCLH